MSGNERKSAEDHFKALFSDNERPKPEPPSEDQPRPAPPLFLAAP